MVILKHAPEQPEQPLAGGVGAGTGAGTGFGTGFGTGAGIGEPS